MRPGGWVAVLRHVGRNYVPLLCGVDADLRYYVAANLRCSLKYCGVIGLLLNIPIII